jgi:hypothetical protein
MEFADINNIDVVSAGSRKKTIAAAPNSRKIMKMVKQITSQPQPIKSNSNMNQSIPEKKTRKKKSPSPILPTPEVVAETYAWQKYEQSIEPPERDAAKYKDYLDRLAVDKNLESLKTILKSQTRSVIDSKCVRGVSNWSNAKSIYKFDKLEFDKNATAKDLAHNSPKLEYILNNIKKLDEADEEKHGHKFKHFIFSDIKGAQGVSAVASVLISAGYTLGYDVKTAKKTTISVKSDTDLKKTRGENFFLLSSAIMFGEPLRVSVKKDVLARFNLRPDNSHGDLARIIVMDSGFKEGIDLFDIKYIHMFEPQVNMSDQRQVIGRGTRTCGQKGLRFNPSSGWPLHVFKYDISISEKYQVEFHGATSGFNYYLQSKNVDIRLVNLASNLERVAIKGSVDYKLNKPIHRFSVDQDDDDEISGGSTELIPAEERLRERLEKDSAPGKKYKAIKKYIDKYFSEYKWPPVKMENLCGFEGPADEPEIKGGAPTLINLSPTQDFISNYFSAANPLKGMVLWQSVGTGKTCTAIATATRQFEPLGYTILWVTRTTLKNDIWKNMFDMVCHEDIREKVDAGLEMPEEMKDKKRLLSKSWSIRPISYKQFSNLVSKNNQYYDRLVNRNGEQDPLRKTLLIIDEAHKLYGGGDLSSIERPDMKEFHRALMNSYAVSGRDSARVIFMTATPITEDPLELVKLVNLCKPIDQQIPTEFNEFADEYLDDTGDFTDNGEKRFLDNIAGHISYLNREGDVRQFARPILKEVDVPLVDRKTKKLIDKFDVVGASEERKQMVDQKIEADKIKEQYTKDLRDYTKGNLAKVYKVCDKYESDEDQQIQCNKLAKKYANQMVKSVKEQTADLRKHVSEIGKEIRLRRTGLTEKIYTARNNKIDDYNGYKKYKTTPYYKLTKCTKQLREYPSFQKLVESQPVYYEAIDLENKIKREVENVQEKFNMDISSQQAKIKSYNKLLKTDLEPIEKQVVKRNIAEIRNSLKKTRKQNNKWMKSLNRRAISSIKKLNKYKKSVKREIRKIVKEQLTTEKKEFKEREKERKMTEMADEDLSDAFKENVEIAKNNVKMGMDEIEEKIAKKNAIEERKTQKRRELEEKKIANATRKQRLALEREEKKTQKIAAAEQKKAEAEQKKIEKLAEMERKKAEKLAAAEQKKVQKKK